MSDSFGDFNGDSVDEAAIVEPNPDGGWLVGWCAVGQQEWARVPGMNVFPQTFDGLEPPSKTAFTASTYMCRGADNNLRIVAVEYEPEGGDMHERRGNITLDTSPLRARIDWATETVGSIIDMAAAWAQGGQCIIE